MHLGNRKCVCCAVRSSAAAAAATTVLRQGTWYFLFIPVVQFLTVADERIPLDKSYEDA